MSTVTDKQIFDHLREYIKPMTLTQSVVNMVDGNLRDTVKRVALVGALGLEQCPNPRYKLDTAILAAIYPGVNVSALQYIIKYAPVFGIVYKQEMAGFLANVLIESQGFNAKRESFAYRPTRLLQVFPSRIKNLVNASNLVAKGQAAIANFLYNGRYGNDTPTSGWDYRGGGWVQLTFKNNYVACQNRTALKLGSNPSLVENMEVSAIAAMDYWYNNGCNEAACKIVGSDVSNLRKIVNGGLNGYDEVRNVYIKAMKLL